MITRLRIVTSSVYFFLIFLRSIMIEVLFSLECVFMCFLYRCFLPTIECSAKQEKPSTVGSKRHTKEAHKLNTCSLEHTLKYKLLLIGILVSNQLQDEKLRPTLKELQRITNLWPFYGISDFS
jgi:hypothetical protein